MGAQACCGYVAVCLLSVTLTVSLGVTYTRDLFLAIGPSRGAHGSRLAKNQSLLKSGFMTVVLLGAFTKCVCVYVWDCFLWNTGMDRTVFLWPIGKIRTVSGGPLGCVV